MKFFAFFSAVLLFTLAGCGTSHSDQPATVVEKFMDAVKSRNGEAATACLSEELISQLCEEASFAGFAEDPQSGVELLASMGAGVSVEDMETMTEESFISAVFGSPLVSSEMTNFETLSVGEAVISDSTATVPVTTEGDIQVFELGHTDEGWKISDFPR